MADVKAKPVAISILFGCWYPCACVPGQAHWIPTPLEKKNRRQSANSFSGHPWSPTFSQAAPEKDNSQPSSDSWIGWLSCRIAVAKTTWIVSAGGLRMEPNFLLYPELSRNLHLPGCYVCVTTSLRKYITTSCSFFHESEHGIKEIR